MNKLTNKSDLKDGLFTSSALGDLPAMKSWLQQGAKVNSKDYYKQTALHYASASGQFHAVIFLLDNNADAKAQSVSKVTPIHLAARYGYPDIILALLENSCDVNARDSSDLTPLHYTTSNLISRPNIAKLLINNGADIGAVTKHNGWTPLHSLIYSNGHIDTLQLLLDKGTNVAAMDKHGRTALDLAIEKGCKQSIELLKHAGGICSKK